MNFLKICEINLVYGGRMSINPCYKYITCNNNTISNLCFCPVRAIAIKAGYTQLSALDGEKGTVYLVDLCVLESGLEKNKKKLS